MREELFALICLSALAGGCGQAGEASFDREFDKSFSSSCIESATRSGAPQAMASQVCDCTLAGINEKFSTAEKLTISEEQAKPIMDRCLEKAVQP